MEGQKEGQTLFRKTLLATAGGPKKYETKGICTSRKDCY